MGVGGAGSAHVLSMAHGWMHMSTDAPALSLFQHDTCFMGWRWKGIRRGGARL